MEGGNMTKQERLRFKELITESLKQARANNIRYEQIAVEAGVSLDTLRRIMYDSKNVPSEITIRKILNWFTNNLFKFTASQRKAPTKRKSLSSESLKSKDSELGNFYPTCQKAKKKITSNEAEALVLTGERSY